MYLESFGGQVRIDGRKTCCIYNPLLHSPYVSPGTQDAQCRSVSTRTTFWRHQVHQFVLPEDSSKQLIEPPTTVLFYYDFALTIHQEIKYIWASKSPFRLVNLLVIAMRYITFFGYIPGCILTFASATVDGTAQRVSFNKNWRVN